MLLAEGASRGLGDLLAEAGVTMNGQSGAILLRALLAPLLLVLSVILSFAAALGFGALAVLPLVVLTEIGFIVAFGVLLDTFIVRAVIVPALVLDIGRRVWWPSRLSHSKAPAK